MKIFKNHRGVRPVRPDSGPSGERGRRVWDPSPSSMANRASYGTLRTGGESPKVFRATPKAERQEVWKRWYSVATYAAATILVVSLVLVGAIFAQQQRSAKVVTLRQHASGNSVYKPRVGGTSLYATRRGAASSSHLDGDSTPLIEISVTNDYGTHVSKDSAYPWLNGAKLVEPHVDTTLAIVQPVDGVLYSWELFPASGSSSHVWAAEGSEVTLKATATGRFVLYVTAWSSEDKAALQVAKETLFCKYVRREMRSLSKSDRDAFLDAAYTLWELSTEEGQQLYGPDYYDIDYFAGYHLTQSSDPACDHMHDGLGFLTQHAALTLKFEKALQAVDPRVTVPYWDYTVDSHYIADNYDGQFSKHWFDSDVFADDIFGRADPDEHFISTGRWAKLEVRKSSANNARNAYGLMRSPWNTSKRKYLIRASTFCGVEWDSQRSHMPTCADHYNAVAGYNTLEDFVWFVPYAPHGTVHSISGGTYGCEAAYQKVKDMGFSANFEYWFSVYSFSNLRRYYRMGLYQCPTECSDDTPQEQCVCSCPDLEAKVESGEWRSLLELAFDIPAYLAEVQAKDDDTQIEYLRTVCSAGILVGDHLEASSAYDISFWPIHPTIDRLWQWKKLKGMFSDETWPSTSFSIYGDSCAGHREDDIIPIPDLVPGLPGNLTNGELYGLMNPSADTLDFVFDTFEWKHCTDYGIDFSNLTQGAVLGGGHR